MIIRYQSIDDPEVEPGCDEKSCVKNSRPDFPVVHGEGFKSPYDRGPYSDHTASAHLCICDLSGSNI